MKADRLLAVIVAVLGTMWVLADELDDLFPKSNKVVAEGGGVKVFRLELDAAVKFALMNAAAEDIPITADIGSLEEQLLQFSQPLLSLILNFLYFLIHQFFPLLFHYYLTYLLLYRTKNILMFHTLSLSYFPLIIKFQN